MLFIRLLGTLIVKSFTIGGVLEEVTLLKILSILETVIHKLLKQEYSFWILYLVSI